jgi:hypothetical protein
VFGLKSWEKGEYLDDDGLACSGGNRIRSEYDIFEGDNGCIDGSTEGAGVNVCREGNLVFKISLLFPLRRDPPVNYHGETKIEQDSLRN